MKKLKPFLLITDVGFIIYWLITLFHLIPSNMLFKDYNNPIMIAWNWSFFPLDMLISLTGLASITLYRRKNDLWKKVCLISLVLTFCSGLQAIAFWSFSLDFDLVWWASNLYFMVYPVIFIPKLLQEKLN